MSKIIRPRTSLVDDSDDAFNKKSRVFVEGLFALNTNLKAGNTLIQDLPDDYTPIGLIEEEGEFDLSRVIKKGLDPVTGMPRDLKIPEGDFKEASNYYEFCTKYVGKDTKMPFARQLWMLLTLFGEICPRCSHPKTKDIFNVPVKIKADRLLEKIQLLDYGKCPKCKGEKHDFVHLGLMNNYIELACEAGQRGGKSTLVSSGVAYLLHKYLMYPKLASVCAGIQNSTTLYGTFIGYRMMDAMALLWMPILDVIEDSKWFCIAEGSEISLESGKKKIEDIESGEKIKTAEGVDEVVQLFYNGVQDCKEVETESGHKLPGTDQHQIRCLGTDGTSLVWKNIGDLTTEDYVVVE